MAGLVIARIAREDLGEDVSLMDDGVEVHEDGRDAAVHLRADVDLEERLHGAGGSRSSDVLRRTHEALARMREALDRAGGEVDRLEADVGREGATSKREQAEVDREIARSRRESGEVRRAPGGEDAP